jgi:F0F1-type ATP synthase membrane subunit b/b'
MVGILFTSLIWRDHPNIFNCLSFSYIMIYFSWKRLINIKKERERMIKQGINEGIR